MKCLLINKTILTITNIVGNYNFYTIKAYNTLFNPNVLYLFDTCKDCTFYSIINIENNNEYEQTVIHKENNNIYHLLTCNTNGNILDKKTFDIVNERLKNIIFDCVILYELYSDYINNVALVYLYIIMEHSNNTTHLLIKIFWHTINLLVNLLNAYDNINIYIPKVGGIDKITYINAYNFKQNNLNYDLIKQILAGKYINIQYTSSTYITQYTNKIYKKMYDIFYTLYNIVKLYDKPEYKIIMQTIRIKQKYYAQKKKYKNILLPY